MVRKNDAIIQCVEIGLKIIGFYPGSLKLKRFIVIIILIIINLPFQILNIVEVYKDIDMFMNTFGPVLAIFNCIIKLIALRINHRTVQNLINEVIDDYKKLQDKLDKEILYKNMKVSDTVIQVIFLSYSCLIFFCVLTSVSSYLRTRTLEGTQYALPATYPFIEKTWLSFGFISFLQVIELIVVAYGHIVMDGLLALLVNYVTIIFVFHAATKVHIVRAAIKTYSDTCCKEADINLTRNMTKNLILKHENYLMFAKNIEDAYVYVTLSHLINVTVQMCVVGYILISIVENTIISMQCLFYLNFIAADLLAVAIYCVAGEYFTKQSEYIHDDLSKCSWHSFHTRNAKEMVILLLKTQKPVVITAGKFSNLSLFYFTTIMKTSFSYLSMLRAMKGRHNN